MTDKIIHAQQCALQIFSAIEKRGLISAGKTEKQLNDEVLLLAEEILGTRKFWHKRIIRAGRNTLLPYRENPPDLILKESDILFFDLGPVLEDWEADIGKTYVLGNDATMHRLKQDSEKAWQKGLEWVKAHPDATGAELYEFTKKLALELGWEYGNEHCGHLVGKFPHEKLQGEETVNYIHPENNERLKSPDRNGNERFWIYEIHLVDKAAGIGAFFEQFLF